MLYNNHDVSIKLFSLLQYSSSTYIIEQKTQGKCRKWAFIQLNKTHSAQFCDHTISCQDKVFFQVILALSFSHNVVKWCCKHRGCHYHQPSCEQMPQCDRKRWSLCYNCCCCESSAAAVAAFGWTTIQPYLSTTRLLCYSEGLPPQVHFHHENAWKSISWI